MTSSIHSKTAAEFVFLVLTAFTVLSAMNTRLARAEPPEPSPSATPADTTTRVKRLFEEGQAHYDLGEYDQAITAFRQAYELSSAPLLLFNIAQSHRLKGDCPRALEVYRHFVRLDPDSRHRGSAEDQIRSLSAQCPRKPQTAAAPSGSAGVTDGLAGSQRATSPDAAPVPTADSSSRQPPQPQARTSGIWSIGRNHVVIGLLSTGLVLAGAATAVRLWNDARFDTWRKEDRALYTAGAGADINEVQRRQAANNDLLASIRRSDTVDLTLAVAAGVSLLTGTGLLVTWHPTTPSNETGLLELGWRGSW
jgi:tetratricopeptide (TPR) repeat protein